MLIKRILDFIAASLLLIIFSPIILGSALLVLIFMGQPIFFLQQRPGYKEKPFSLIKFRTMRLMVKAESDAKRLTTLGKVLRKTSIDELPQLVNVLKGEMSLVGPRPLLIKYLPYYTEAERRRHDMLPGITGWAQVSGRNSLGWDERLVCDVWYVDNWSLAFDFKIILKTIGSIFRAKGVEVDPASVLEDLDVVRAKKV